MSTHDGWIDPYAFLRVDNFSMQKHPVSGAFPLYYLLTHAHSDHLNGLDAKGFNGKLYMTAPTKQLVLDFMEAQERVRYAELGNRIKPSYKFANLEMRRSRKDRHGQRISSPSIAQQIVTIDYNKPFELEGPDGKSVRVVAIDANHCPGSCMYLIEGQVAGRENNVLVTGDIRIDADYLEILRRNPFLTPYIGYESPADRNASSSELFASSESAGGSGDHGATDERPRKRKKVPVKTFSRIYLDTSQAALNEGLVTKEQAVADLVELIDLYPDDTVFFLNAWTHGYEDMLKGVYRAYGEKIHVDWHKGKMYTSEAMRQSDPLLADLVHPDPMPSALPQAATSHPPFVGRFHACERRWKCDDVWQDGVGCYCWEDEYQDQLQGVKQLRRPGSGERLSGRNEKLVVNINPAEMPKWTWDECFEEKKDQIALWNVQQAQGVPYGEEAVELPTSLVVPLARHSSLPELRSFVALFNPVTIYPLTCSHPKLYKVLPSIFGDVLAAGGKEQLQQEALVYAAGYAARLREKLLAAALEDEDEHDGLIVPDFVAEISKKGLNIEGGETAIRDHERWMRTVKAKTAGPSASPAQQAPQPGPSRKRRDDGEDDDDGLCGAPAARDGNHISSDWVVISRPTPAAGAQSSSSRQQANALGGKERTEARNVQPSSADLAPAGRARMPSPFLGASQAEQPRITASAQRLRMPSPFLGASQAEQPRLMSPFCMDSSGSPSRASASPTTSAAPRNRPSPELGMPTRHVVSQGRALESPVLPSHPLTNLDPGIVQNPIASSSNVAISTASGFPSHGAVLPLSSQTDRQQRKLYIETFYRRFRGMIGADGRIVPFEEGDPRLQGRRPLKATEGSAHARKENQAVQLSPGTFRTVSATASP